MRRKTSPVSKTPSRPAARRLSPESGPTRLGRLVGLGKEAEVEVLLESRGTPIPARSMVPVTPDDLGREVAVSVSENRGIVLGFVQSAEALAKSRALTGQSVEARLDGERVVLQADREIELRCGKASLLLRADGKIILRGENVVSSAAATNRIRGGSVQIN